MKTRCNHFSAPPEKTGTTFSSILREGELLLRGNGGSADLILKDQRRQIAVTSDSNPAVKQIEQSFSPAVLQGMDEDGTLLTLRARDLPLGLLFRLPPRGLRQGESVEVPIRVPLEGHGSLLQVDGVARMTLTGFADVAGHPCARLDTEIAIDKLAVPGEVQGRYSFQALGSSVLFFDVGEGTLLSGGIALRLKKRDEAPAPLTVIDGVPRTDRPERYGTESDSDILVIVGR